MSIRGPLTLLSIFLMDTSVLAADSGSALVYKADSDGIIRIEAGVNYYGGDESDICLGDKFFDSMGVIHEGSRLCEPFEICTEGGQKECLTHGDGFKAASSKKLDPRFIKRGSVIGGVTGEFPSEKFPLPRYGSGSPTVLTESGSDITDLTSFSDQILVGSAFEYWDSYGIRYINEGDSRLNSVNLRYGQSVFGQTGIANRLPLAAVSTLSAIYDSGTELINLSWTNMGYKRYLVVARSGAAVDFSPVDGVTYPTGLDGDNNIIYVGSNTSFNHDVSSLGGTLYYAVYGYEDGPFYADRTSTSASILLPAVASFSGAFNSLTGAIDLTWTDSNYDAYVVVARIGANIAFSPADGTTYAVGMQGADSMIYVGSNKSFSHNIGTSSGTVQYRIFGYKSGDYYSAPRATSVLILQAREWRVVITAADKNYTKIGEVEFRIAGVWQTNAATGTSSGTIAGKAIADTSSSSIYPNINAWPWRAFDNSFASYGTSGSFPNNISRFWMTNTSKLPGFEWLRVLFVDKVAFDGMRIKSEPASCATSFYLQFYNTDSLQWVAIPVTQATNNRDMCTGGWATFSW